MQICFTSRDLEVFCQASGDRNPLHNDALYAQKTSYGEPVVFGALGVVAGLGYLPRDEQLRVSGLRADFHRPMFCNVNYEAECSASGDKRIVRLKDGSVPVLTTTVTLSEDVPAGRVVSQPFQGSFTRDSATNLVWSEIHTGDAMLGHYRMDSGGLHDLEERWRVQAIPRFILESTLWSSYLIGMEMPGESALFFSAVIRAGTAAFSSKPGFHYTATVKDKNDGRSQLRLEATLTNGGTELGNAQLTAFFRPALNRLPLFSGVRESGHEGLLSGKRAVLIGGSRGFGAALAVALVKCGAKVHICSRSGPQWFAQVAEGIRAAVEHQALDAGDVRALESFGHDLSAEGPIDLVVSLACPPIPSLRLEPNGFERIRAYMAKANDLVASPLCAFMPILSKGKGCFVLVSSAAVEEPVREWPHYVAAKAAAEALVQVAGLQYPDVSTLVFRPDRMLTDMTNTPMGRLGAANPSEVALDLIERLTAVLTSSRELSTRVPISA